MTSIPRVIVTSLEIEDVALERIERRELLDRWYQVMTDNESVVASMLMNGISFHEIGIATGRTRQNCEQHWRNALKKFIALHDGQYVPLPEAAMIRRSTEAKQFDDVDLGDPDLDIEGAA